MLCVCVLLLFKLHDVTNDVNWFSAFVVWIGIVAVMLDVVTTASCRRWIFVCFEWVGECARMCRCTCEYMFTTNEHRMHRRPMGWHNDKQALRMFSREVRVPQVRVPRAQRWSYALQDWHENVRQRLRHEQHFWVRKLIDRCFLLNFFLNFLFIIHMQMAKLTNLDEYADTPVGTLEITDPTWAAKYIQIKAEKYETKNKFEVATMFNFNSKMFQQFCADTVCHEHLKILTLWNHKRCWLNDFSNGWCSKQSWSKQAWFGSSQSEEGRQNNLNDGNKNEIKQKQKKHSNNG